MSESNEERSPGFRRSLTGKIVGAGIFVALGTVAVAYSMNYCKTCSNAETVAAVDENEPGSKSSKETSDSTALQLKPISGDQPPKLVGDNNSSGFSSSLNPASTKRVTAQRPASGLPKSKSFAMPKVLTPTTNSGAKQGNDFGAVRQVKTLKTGSFGAQQDTLQNPQRNAPLNNRFQQPKRNTNQFANNAASAVAISTGDIASKTGNTLRNIRTTANQVKQKLPNNSSANPTGFSLNAQQLPQRQNTLPPIAPRASFDTSKDLRPFSPKNASQLNRGSATKPPFVAQPSSSTLPVRQPTNNLSRPTTPSNPVSSRGGISANTVSRTRDDAATHSTPGDRKLEGLQAPAVTIEKIAPREIQVNQPADFQLVVKNVGRIEAKNVRVFDQIPAGTELIQSTPQPSRGPGNQISWELDTLNPGQEKRIKIQLRPIRPGEIGSVAQVTFSAQASMRTKVTKPVLAIRHTVQPRVLIGDSLTLDIDVKNEGDGPATDVIIQENLPSGLEFSEGFRELEYAVGTLGPGQSKKIRLQLRAAKIGKYRNILVAHAGGGLQTQHAVDVEVIAPKLEATGEGPVRRFLRREATHRFALRNSGTAPATNVELVCRLPSGLKYISSNNRGKYDENSHAVYWSLAELNSGLVANVELTTTPTESGNQDLKFEAVSDLGQSTDAICKLNVEHLVDVFFDIDDLVDPIEIGSKTAYKLRIVNQGTKTAANVRLQVEFPQGMQPISVEGNVTNEIRGHSIAFSPITSLNPGDEIEITIHGKGLTAGDHRVSVSLTADGRDVDVSKQESTRVYSDR